MPLSPESIIGLFTLFVTFPPTAWLLYTLYQRHRFHRQECLTPKASRIYRMLIRVAVLPLHSSNRIELLQRSRTWSYSEQVLIAEPLPKATLTRGRFPSLIQLEALYTDNNARLDQLSVRQGLCCRRRTLL
jgi:hypothetical protein